MKKSWRLRINDFSGSKGRTLRNYTYTLIYFSLLCFSASPVIQSQDAPTTQQNSPDTQIQLPSVDAYLNEPLIAPSADEFVPKQPEEGTQPPPFYSNIIAQQKASEREVLMN